MGAAPEAMSHIEPTPRSYRWPWVVWGAFALAIILVVAAVTHEARRVHRLKLERIESGYLPALTNPP